MKFICGVFVCCLTLTLGSCIKDDTILQTQFYSNIMVNHASPKAAGLDVLVDNVKNNTLLYKNSTTYMKVLEGAHSIKINQTGTSNVEVEVNPTLLRNKFYTLFAINEGDFVQPFQVDDNFTTPSTTMCKVRLLNFIPDAPNVDLQYDGGGAIFTGKKYKDLTEFSEINIGPTDLRIVQTGTNNVLVDIPVQYFEKQKVYTIVLSGYNTGFQTPPMTYQIIANN